jgi:hypothetical protein
MVLAVDMKALKFPILSATLKVSSLQDLRGLEIATVRKFRPRTKHLNIKLHFFR